MHLGGYHSTQYRDSLSQVFGIKTWKHLFVFVNSGTEETCKELEWPFPSMYVKQRKSNYREEKNEDL